MRIGHMGYLSPFDMLIAVAALETALAHHGHRFESGAGVVAVARRVRTGQIAVNGCIPGDAPFGGFKQSGLGREGGGLQGLHQYMEPKAIGIPA